MSATGWRKLNAKTRLGVQHRTQLATRATVGGLFNRCQLDVIVRGLRKVRRTPLEFASFAAA